jgi:hypothetical protein
MASSNTYCNVPCLCNEDPNIHCQWLLAFRDSVFGAVVSLKCAAVDWETCELPFAPPGDAVAKYLVKQREAF